MAAFFKSEVKQDPDLKLHSLQTSKMKEDRRKEQTARKSGAQSKHYLISFFFEQDFDESFYTVTC